MRHYQMRRNHGDALYADNKKKGAMPPGRQLRRGYIAVQDGGVMEFPPPATSPEIEKSDRAHRPAFGAQGKRAGSVRRRQWEHRKVAGAKRGEIVHHIDGNGLNNERSNLHVFPSPAEHKKAHRSLELIAYQLLRDGSVSFDRRAGIYRLRRSSSRSKP